MKRRTALQTLGLAATVGIAGCLGDSTGAANEYDYETTTTDGVAVPLVPVADAIEWHRNDEAVFADTRSQTAFSRARIAGAVFSPAPDGQETDDPLADESEDTQIVTYCTCPHHLSSMRAASLISDGYRHTYALDEGFNAWSRNGYPVEGGSSERLPTSYRIEGQTDPTHAGEFAWAYHDPSGQREPAKIGDNGQFTISFQFYDIDGGSSIRVETPDGTVTRPLEQLRDSVVKL